MAKSLSKCERLLSPRPRSEGTSIWRDGTGMGVEVLCAMVALFLKTGFWGMQLKTGTHMGT